MSHIHQTYGNGFVVDSLISENKDFIKILSDHYHCWYNHQWDYIMKGKKYKKYRRGKNRCRLCGLKKGG